MCRRLCHGQLLGDSTHIPSYASGPHHAKDDVFVTAAYLCYRLLLYFSTRNTDLFLLTAFRCLQLCVLR